MGTAQAHPGASPSCVTPSTATDSDGDGVRDKGGVKLSFLPFIIKATVAALQPKSVADLDAIPTMRNWQKQVLGEALVAASK